MRSVVEVRSKICTFGSLMGSSRPTWEPNSPGWLLTASALREADMFAY